MMTWMRASRQMPTGLPHLRADRILEGQQAGEAEAAVWFAAGHCLPSTLARGAGDDLVGAFRQFPGEGLPVFQLGRGQGAHGQHRLGSPLQRGKVSRRPPG